MSLINMWETPPSGQPKFSCACENSKIYWFNIFAVDMASKFWAFGQAHIYGNRRNLPPSSLQRIGVSVPRVDSPPRLTEPESHVPIVRTSHGQRWTDAMIWKWVTTSILGESTSKTNYHQGDPGRHVAIICQCDIDPKFKNCSDWFGRIRSFSECDGTVQ